MQYRMSHRRTQSRLKDLTQPLVGNLLSEQNLHQDLLI